MSAWAKPGVKCVCIHDGWWVAFGPERSGALPEVNGTYTIDSVVTGPDGDTYLVLAEFSPRDRFWVERFRPLIAKSQDQDVGLFVHHLESAPVGEDA